MGLGFEIRNPQPAIRNCLPPKHGRDAPKGRHGRVGKRRSLFPPGCFATLDRHERVRRRSLRKAPYGTMTTAVAIPPTPNPNFRATHVRLLAWSPWTPEAPPQSREAVLQRAPSSSPLTPPRRAPVHPPRVRFRVGRSILLNATPPTRARSVLSLLSTYFAVADLISVAAATVRTRGAAEWPFLPFRLFMANPRSDLRILRRAEALQFGRPILDRRARSIQPTTLR